MFSLLEYPDDFSESHGLNQVWAKDTSSTAVLNDNLGLKIRQNYIVQKLTEACEKGTFSFRMLLRHIFSFCDVYVRKHELTLVRKTVTMKFIELVLLTLVKL